MSKHKSRPKGAWGVKRETGNLKSFQEVEKIIRFQSAGKAKIKKKGKLVYVSRVPIIWESVQLLGGRWSKKRKCYIIPIKD